MADVRDVAQFILEQAGPMTAMKLQKLVYYAQAWNIAWRDDVLFPERIEAWADGPVCPDLFRAHRGAFRVSSIPGGDSSALKAKEKHTIMKVLKFYGSRSPQWLSDLTHNEAPWKDARRGLPDRAPSSRQITPEAMGTYYSSL
jgi:uncharacterized phage-associated protein